MGIPNAAAAILSCVFYCTVGPLLIFLNKHILSDTGFKFPVMLTMMGMLASSLISALLCLVGVSKRANAHRITLDFYLRNIMPIGLLIGATMYLGNMAYVYLSVAYIQMLKAFSPVILMCISFAMGMESPSRPLIVSVCVITGGTLVSSMGELHFSMVGFLAMMGSNVTDCIRLLMQQRLLTDFKFGIIEGIYYIYPAAAFWLGLFFIAIEKESFDKGGGLAIMQKHPGYFVAAALLGFCINFASFLVIKYTSSLTLKVLSNARNAAIVVAAALLFSEPVTGQQVVGYTITLVGFLYYNQVRAAQSQQKASSLLPAHHGAGKK